MLTYKGKAIFSSILQNKIFKQTLELTKFKLSLLNGIVTIGAYSLYPVASSCLPLLAASVALSMSTQALNQYIEVELDRKMVRTSQRPLVKGVNPKIALGLGATLGVAGLAGLMTYNPLTAGIGAAIWVSYLFIYTKMKQQSETNTFVGAIIGSLPVYLGWAASGRSICMV